MSTEAKREGSRKIQLTNVQSREVGYFFNSVGDLFSSSYTAVRIIVLFKNGSRFPCKAITTNVTKTGSSVK